MELRRMVLFAAVAATTGLLAADAHSLSATVASSVLNRPSVRLCGTHLTNVVLMLCRDRGGVHSHVRRRAARLSDTPINRFPSYIIYKPSPSRRNSVSGEQQETSTASSSQDSSRENRYFGNSQTGGIVEECCLRACSFRTLVSYCAEPHAGETLESVNVIASPPDGPEADARNGFLSDAAPPTPPPPQMVAQAVAEVAREHNQVESHSSGQGSRLLSSGSYRKAPQSFVARPRIGTFSRHQPYWIVLQSGFDSSEDEGPTA
ncbi:uncharacterized protein LOC135401441 isoform X2 [Ornithodoros turicata]|uniref:uncharacterized protein LOC135401441 isoform X2 n=1 Tax=Ornithodoros turicata TaxID=34597 RepID=UPI00313A251C